MCSSSGSNSDRRPKSRAEGIRSDGVPVHNRRTDPRTSGNSGAKSENGETNVHTRGTGAHLRETQRSGVGVAEASAAETDACASPCLAWHSPLAMTSNESYEQRHRQAAS